MIKLILIQLIVMQFQCHGGSQSGMRKDSEPRFSDKFSFPRIAFLTPHTTLACVSAIAVDLRTCARGCAALFLAAVSCVFGCACLHALDLSPSIFAVRICSIGLALFSPDQRLCASWQVPSALDVSTWCHKVSQTSRHQLLNPNH